MEGTEFRTEASNRCAAAQASTAAASRLPPFISLAAGRGVGRAKLDCLLPNLDHLFLREKARELDIVERSGSYHDSGDRRCCSRIGHIEDRQDSRAFGRHAVERDQLAAGGLDQFSGYISTVLRGVLEKTVDGSGRVLSREAEMHGDLLLLGF